MRVSLRLYSGRNGEGFQMFTRYRFIYFLVVLALMLGMGYVSAASKAGQARFPIAFADLGQPSETDSEETPSQYETGNLSEAGAVELTTDLDWKAARAASRQSPAIVFKHSTRCEISAGAYRRMADWLEARGEEAPKVFFVDVIESRPISQRIEQETGVKHESPQVIVLDDGEPVFDTSHEAITIEALDRVLPEDATDQ